MAAKPSKGSYIASIIAGALSIIIPYCIVYTDIFSLKQAALDQLSIEVFRFTLAIVLITPAYKVSRLLLSKAWQKDDSSSVYGLQHGRLHLQVPTPMWMNMGYWKGSTDETTLSEACRDLLKTVLAEAGLDSRGMAKDEAQRVGRKRCLIDLGFGCGDQTVYLTSTKPLSPRDEIWWDETDQLVLFDHYVGITKDRVQAQYASERIAPLKQKSATSTIDLFCADASNPSSWPLDLHAAMNSAIEECPACWVLALDTAYHFSPSRWPVINYASSQLRASFMAFDLCLSPTATLTQKFVLRLLTTLMGAPWANFVTPDEYLQNLVAAGYSKDTITIIDISEHVFAPLAKYVSAQEKRLGSLGLTLGSLTVAGTMFGWWGRCGVVRGVVVVARK